jgi:uncharacterized protein YeaO (DUF488 family)
MPARIVRLGSKRAIGEGLRIGTVRLLPRGVPKARYAKDDWFDVWFPVLAPSKATFKMGRAASNPQQWKKFFRRYEKEMSAPECSRAIDLLAALSRQTDFSVGCYCEEEARCHRSVLRRLLKERGAKLA